MLTSCLSSTRAPLSNIKTSNGSGTDILSLRGMKRDTSDSKRNSNAFIVSMSVQRQTRGKICVHRGKHGHRVTSLSCVHDGSWSVLWHKDDVGKHMGTVFGTTKHLREQNGTLQLGWNLFGDFLIKKIIKIAPAVDGISVLIFGTSIFSSGMCLQIPGKLEARRSHILLWGFPGWVHN